MRKKTISLRATSRTTGEQPRNSLSISACATMSPCPAPSATIVRTGSIPPSISPLQVPGVGPNGGSGPLVGGEVFASSTQRKVNDTDWKDWQPRFGFAYQFSPKWVVRGGFGVYYSQNKSGVTGVAPYSSQGFNQYTSMVTTYQNDGATPYLRLSNPYPNGLIQPPGNSLGLLNDVGFGAVGPIRTIKVTPSEDSWTLGIERQLPWNILVDVEYVGKKGNNLYFGGDNQLDILGPQIENYSQDQISQLQTYVNNPFAGLHYRSE